MAISEQRKHRKLLLIFVGDLIDRGPSSAQVIERLRTYKEPGVRTVFLLGNHEEVLLRILGGDKALISKWSTFGGAECLRSYGVDPAIVGRMREDDALEAIRAAIPREHVKFLESLDDDCRFGDYLFVHAGIRPGVEFDQQRQSDLRWIREPFCSTRLIMASLSSTATPSGPRSSASESHRDRHGAYRTGSSPRLR